MKPVMNQRTILCTIFACIVTTGFHVSSLAQSPIRVSELKLFDTNGESIVRTPVRFTVYCFLGTECPLARLYGPRLQRLADKFAGSDVSFIGVNSNIQDSPREIDAYAKEYSIRFPIAKDNNQSVADVLSATRTPEVVMVDARGHVKYQGRIDDQYEPGISRPEPTKEDLHDAIVACLAGLPVEHPQTQGVGCLISRIKTRNDHDISNQKTDSQVTYTRDIAALLNRHCVECHREGEIGPFALTDYDEVIGWGPMILEVIDQQRMPPWHADAKIGQFQGERVLPSEARDTFAAWINDGMPEGDKQDLPEQPMFSSGWHLPSPPDVEFVMRDRPFRVPAEGVVEYQYFVVDPKWDKDRWIRAAQVIPGDASVVHHSIVFVRPPDGSRSNGIGWLGAYVPGQRTFELPAAHGRLVPARSKLIFQMHYTPNGKPAQDKTRVGVWFADEDRITHEVVTQVTMNHKFEIPPGDSNYQVQMSSGNFPASGKMLGVAPHMHLRGKSFLMNAVRMDGTQKPLLSVPAYDFNWQHWYAFNEPICLKDMDSLDMTVTFDNSSDNPFNPAPHEYVSWGDQTFEEMAIAFLDISCPVGSWNSRSNRRDNPRFLPSDEDLETRKKKVDEQVNNFLTRLDTDHDGVVSRDEAPLTMRRNGFHVLDHDRDGRITQEEIRASAEQRL